MHHNAKVPSVEVDVIQVSNAATESVYEAQTQTQSSQFWVLQQETK